MEYCDEAKIMDAISNAVSEMESSGCADAVDALQQTLGRLREGAKENRLFLHAAHSERVIHSIESCPHPGELLGVVLLYVQLDVPPSVWWCWYQRHYDDCMLAHVCPVMEILMLLSDRYAEAAIGYAVRMYIGEQYSASELEAFLASKQHVDYLIKGIVLALPEYRTKSPEKKEVVARYLSLVASADGRNRRTGGNRRTRID